MRKILPIVLLLATACATNPVTQKREPNLAADSDDIRIGEQAYQQTINDFGLYDEKPDLARLVDTIGRRLASISERPNLPWHFAILDTPIADAMALPGGYVFVTRGMLERINSEDELAAVLAHEIAHVTARHAAHAISRGELAQFDLGPDRLLPQRYSRGQEHEADVAGIEIVARAGWNPIGMERMLTTLERPDKHAAEKYFQSHPNAAKRIPGVTRKIRQITSADPAAVKREPERASYIRLVDGIMTGSSTERVTIRHGTIYDREHGLIVHAPAGWNPTAAEGMLFAMTRKGSQREAFMAEEVSDPQVEGTSAREAVRKKLREMGLQLAGSQQARAESGRRFAIDEWVGEMQSGSVGVETTQFPRGDHVAVMMFLAPSLERGRSPLGTLLRRSAISVARARAAEPARIRVTIARDGDTWAELARRSTGSVRDAEAVANLNGFDVGEPPKAGILVKLPGEVTE